MAVVNYVPRIMEPLTFIAALFLLSSCNGGEIFLDYTNYTLQYEKCNDEWKVNINPDEGLGLAVTIVDLFLNPDKEAYLAISAVEDMTGTKASVTYITGDQKDLRLAIPLTSTAHIKLNGQEQCDQNQNFTIIMQPYETQVPYVPPPGPNPLPPSGIPTDILVFFENKTLAQFQDATLQEKLKARIKSKAGEFCSKSKITCNLSKPSNETVFFFEPKTCPNTFEDYETCVSTWMAVYVSSGRGEYQLSPRNLQKMWDGLSQEDFKGLGIRPYSFPLISVAILWWVLWIVIAVGIAGLLGIVFCRVEIYTSHYKMYLADLEAERIEHEEFDGVQLRRKIKPNKHQTIPDFRDDDVSDEAPQTPAKPNLFIPNIINKGLKRPFGSGKPPPPKVSGLKNDGYLSDGDNGESNT